MLGVGKSANSFQSVTTNGTSGNPGALGLQDRKVGPVGAFQGDEITIGEGMAPGSATTDISLYSPEYQCTYQDASGTEIELQLETVGGGMQLVVPATLPGSWKGPEVKCTITNEGRAPKLLVSKSSIPESTTVVAERSTVQYSLIFDNSGGGAPATDIAYTDHLADVLDDADLVPGSLKVRDVTDADEANHVDVTDGFFAHFHPDTSTIQTSGTSQGTGAATVPAGKKYALVYEVLVKKNVDDEGETREDGANTHAYRMTNYLVEGDAAPPETCDVPDAEAPGADEQPLCTDHPVKAWTASKKSSLPESGSTLHINGNIYYSLEVAKFDSSYAVEDIVVADNLTEVYNFATWVDEVSETPNAGARTRGIYFFDSEGANTRTINADNLPAGTTLDEWVPAPTETAGEWTLQTKPFTLEPGEVSAQVWFAVKINNPVDGETGTPFKNTYSALAGEGEPKPNQCVTGVLETHKPQCETTHQVAQSSFTIRKDGIGTLEDGTRGHLEDLIGHEFEVRVDDSGSMGSAQPANKCETEGSDPDTCWTFAPTPSGDLAGRWRADRLPAGTYWLLETRAPNAQRVSATESRAVTGVQLLAEPIKFRVASAAESGENFPVPGIPAKNVGEGQVDVFAVSGSHLADRCEMSTGKPQTTVCVNPTGDLMVVKDPGMLALPFTGAVAPWLLGFLGLGGLALLIGGAYRWSTRHEQPVLESPHTSGE